MSKTDYRKTKSARYDENGLRVGKSQTHAEHLREKRRNAALHRKDPTMWLDDEDD